MKLDWILKGSDASFSRRIEGLPSEARRMAVYIRMRFDPAYFARQVLGRHCRLPFAGFHNILFGWHHEMEGPIDKRQGRRYAIAAPRGTAKSTIVSLVLPLHDILFRRERYIILLSATDRQARGRLRAIREELERGEIAQWLADRPHRLTAKTLTCGNIRLDAFGAGTEIRGVTHDGHRPTKIILDDAEGSDSATSPRARERLDEWFASIVEHLGDRHTHLIVAGTVLHPAGLLATILTRADFNSHLQRSIEDFATESHHWEEWRQLLLNYLNPDRRQLARNYFEENREEMLKGSSVAWPEREDYEILLAQLIIQGRRAFYQEKQNEPLGPEDALFRGETALRAIQVRGRLEINNASGVTVRVYQGETIPLRFGYLDAAMGKKRNHGDFAALAIVLLLPDSTMVVEKVWARRVPPSVQVAQILDSHEERPFTRLAIEGTGFQELFLRLIDEERSRRSRVGREICLPIEVVHPKRSKSIRIATLEPLLSSGRLALCPTLDEEFWEELANYPRSRHDDALDAVAGAVDLALRGEGKGSLLKVVPRDGGGRRPAF